MRGDIHCPLQREFDNGPGGEVAASTAATTRPIDLFNSTGGGQ